MRKRQTLLRSCERCNLSYISGARSYRACIGIEGHSARGCSAESATLVWITAYMSPLLSLCCMANAVSCTVPKSAATSSSGDAETPSSPINQTWHCRWPCVMRGMFTAYHTTLTLNELRVA